MKMLARAALLLFALLTCAHAMAQTVGFTPLVVPPSCYGTPGGPATCVDNQHGLPTSPTIAAATSVEVSNTPAIGTTILGPFVPQLGRDLRVVISGTGWAGTVTIGTSSTAEACSTFNPLTAGGQGYASFSSNANEAVDTPTLAGVVYCAREVITTAGATVRVRQ